MLPLLILRTRTREISKLTRRLITIREIKEELVLVASASKMIRKDLLSTRTISVLVDNKITIDLIMKLLLLLLVLTALISVMSFHPDSKTEDQPGLKTKDLISSSAIPTMDVLTLIMVDVVVMGIFLSLLDLLRSKL